MTAELEFGFSEARLSDLDAGVYGRRNDYLLIMQSHTRVKPSFCHHMTEALVNRDLAAVLKYL